MRIEKELKDIREKAGLTQEQVAEAVMVSRQTISNWENGRSLPDIVSLMKLSELYKISLDELLKGDHKLQEKIENDATVAEANKKVILITAITILLSLAIYFISIFVGGAFNDFCENAIRWVLSVIGVAFAAIFLYNVKKNSTPKLNKGAYIMKKLQVLSIILLLFGIWLAIFPLDSGSNLPEAASMLSTVSGLGCGVASLFFGDK